MTNEEFQQLVLEKLTANETFQAKMITFQQQVNEKLSANETFQKQITEKLTSLESQVSENTQILKALEHKAEVYKADVDNLTHGIAILSSEVKSSSKKLEKKVSIIHDRQLELEVRVGDIELQLPY